jgi:uncharacterized repeat protein (TIGR01451 family)
MGFDISMKFFSKFRMWAMLATVLMAIGTRAEAQLGIGYLVSGSPNPVGLNSNLTYTINLTNNTIPPNSVPFIYVTNTLDVHSTLISATNAYSIGSFGSTATNGNIVVFGLVPFGQNGIAQMTIVVQPTAVGFITNTVTFNINGVTNISGNVINQVTNAVLAQADLAVAITGPASAVFTNDWMTYGVNVTNLGPNDASNVMLTNTLPPGVAFKNFSPSNQVPNVQGGNVILSLGTLASGAFTNFLLTVQPTNAGASTFVSVVNSTSVTDPVTTNNTATSNIPVLNYFAGQFTTSIVSTQKYNPQNGLVEQLIVVTNIGTTGTNAVRVVVTGLSNQLYNAWGTNSGYPFVVYATNLDAGRSVSLLLQYIASAYFPFTNSQLQAFAVSIPNLAPPPGVAVSTNLNIAHIIRLAASGDMLIEFPSLTNRTYTVVYSDNVWFSNAMLVPPSILAPANRTQWIDYGPPGTVSHPTNTSVRFYQVFLNP